MISGKWIGIKLLAWLAVLAGLFAFYFRSPVAADGMIMSDTRELYFAQLADGGGYVTEMILANTGELELVVVLDLFHSSGSPYTATINGATNSSFTWAVKSHGSLFLKTSGSSAQVNTGWARVKATGPVGGSINYYYVEEGQTLSEAGSASSLPVQEFCFTMDYRMGIHTGLAVANPNDQAVVIQYALYDVGGNLKGQAIHQIGAMQHVDKLIDEIFPDQNLTGFSGTMTAYSTGGLIVAMPLHFNAALNILSGVPVITGLSMIFVPPVTLYSSTTMEPNTTIPTILTTVNSTSTSTSSSTTTTSTLHSYPSAGELFGVDSIVGNLRYLPAGTFTQGTPLSEIGRTSWEGPQFQHTLTRNMAVMETAVTRQMWADLRNLQPTLPADPTCLSHGVRMTNPVQCVNWYKAVLFANLLSQQKRMQLVYYADSGLSIPISSGNYQGGTVFMNSEANGYRLPTEGEREYFTRAGMTGQFSIIEPGYNSWTVTDCTAGLLAELEKVSWFCSNSGNTTHPVGTKAANPWGLKDVHGNVMEWCWDWYADYPETGQTDYLGSSEASYRVVRGGTWNDYPDSIRSGNRAVNSPNDHYNNIGFRLLRRVN